MGASFFLWVKTPAIVRCGLVIKDLPAIERETALKTIDG
jgi:hypothetical protein